MLLIGDGKLASHLIYYLRTRGLDVVQWSRRRGVIADATAGLPTAAASSRARRNALPELLAQADRVLLAIRDDALADFVAQHRHLSDALWVHFSGSAVVDGAWSAHPLCTFTGPLYEPERYAAVPFIVEQEGPPLGELIPGLDNPSTAIPRANKPLYHALCVAAGNLSQMLWQQLFEGFEQRLGLPAELALPFLQQSASNLERSLPKNDESDVLTGPIVRQDLGTIQRNLAALRAANRPELAEVYEAGVRLARVTSGSQAPLAEVA